MLECEHSSIMVLKSALGSVLGPCMINIMLWDCCLDRGAWWVLFCNLICINACEERSCLTAYRCLMQCDGLCRGAAVAKGPVRSGG